MACAEIIKMRDRNSGCTRQPDRCWLVPNGFVAQIGSRFDPIVLGWAEDINCVTYNASTDDCVSCLDAAPCAAPLKAGTTSLTRRSDNTGTLAVNYGAASDTLVYRLIRTTDNQPVWTAQGAGASKSFLIGYTFPANGSYTLTVERAGQSACPSTETISMSGTTATGVWSKDGDDLLVG